MLIETASAANAPSARSGSSGSTRRCGPSGSTIAGSSVASARQVCWWTARSCPILRSESPRHLPQLSRRRRAQSRRDDERGGGLRRELLVSPSNATMIDPDYVRCMARYNRWQNDNLYAIADSLSDGERRRERGAFFGSIHATLNHLLWADRIWMSRLAGTMAPGGGIAESASLYAQWDDLKRERKASEPVMTDSADRLDAPS